MRKRIKRRRKSRKKARKTLHDFGDGTRRASFLWREKASCRIIGGGFERLKQSGQVSYHVRRDVMATLHGNYPPRQRSGKGIHGSTRCSGTTSAWGSG